MTNTPLYYAEYLKIYKLANYRFKFLVESLEYETGHLERLSLFEDILLENESNLNLVFQASKHDDVVTIAFAELISLPRQTIIENTAIFESIFSRAITGKYLYSCDKALINIRALFAKKKCGLSMNFIKDILYDKALDTKIKIAIAQDVSENDDYSLNINWSTINLATNSFIIPAYMYVFHKRDPEKSLSALITVDIDFANNYFDFFFYPIEITLLQLLQVQNKFKEYFILKQRIKSKKILDIIDDTINKSSELRSFIDSPEVYAINLNEESYALRLKNFAFDNYEMN